MDSWAKISVKKPHLMVLGPRFKNFVFCNDIHGRKILPREKLKIPLKYSGWGLSDVEFNQEHNETIPNTHKPTVLQISAILYFTQKKFRQGFPPTLSKFIVYYLFVTRVVQPSFTPHICFRWCRMWIWTLFFTKWFKTPSFKKKKYDGWPGWELWLQV